MKIEIESLDTAKHFFNGVEQLPFRIKGSIEGCIERGKSRFNQFLDEAERATSLYLKRKYAYAPVTEGLYPPTAEEMAESKRFTGQPLSNHHPLIYAGGFTLVGLATLAACGAPNSAQVQPAERATAIPQATSEVEPTKAISKDFVKVLDEEITPKLKSEFPNDQIKKVTGIAIQNPKDPNNSLAYSVIKTDKDTYVKFDGHKAEEYSTEVVTLETGEVNIRWVTKESAGKDSKLFLIVNLGKLPEGKSLTEATITEAFADQGRLKSYLFYDPDTETYVLYNGVPQNLFQRALDNLVATTYAEGLFKPEKTPTAIATATNIPPLPSPTNTKVPPIETATPETAKFSGYKTFKGDIKEGGKLMISSLPDGSLLFASLKSDTRCEDASYQPYNIIKVIPSTQGKNKFSFKGGQTLDITVTGQLSADGNTITGTIVGIDHEIKVNTGSKFVMIPCPGGKYTFEVQRLPAEGKAPLMATYRDIYAVRSTYTDIQAQEGLERFCNCKIPDDK